MKKLALFICLAVIGGGNSFSQNEDRNTTTYTDTKTYLLFLQSKYDKLIQLAENVKDMNDVMAFKNLFAPSAETVLMELDAHKVSFQNNEKVSLKQRNGKVNEMSVNELVEEFHISGTQNLMKQLNVLKSAEDKEAIEESFTKFIKTVTALKESLNL